MTTLLIAYIVIGIVLGLVLMVTEIIPTYRVSMQAKSVIAVILLSALGFGMIGVPTYIQKTDVIGDAELVERFEDADLYYEPNNDLYFAVETNKWNPFELYKRLEIPQELIAGKIEGESTKTDP